MLQLKSKLCSPKAPRRSFSSFFSEHGGQSIDFFLSDIFYIFQDNPSHCYSRSFNFLFIGCAFLSPDKSGCFPWNTIQQVHLFLYMLPQNWHNRAVRSAKQKKYTKYLSDDACLAHNNILLWTPIYFATSKLQNFNILS